MKNVHQHESYHKRDDHHQNFKFGDWIHYLIVPHLDQDRDGEWVLFKDLEWHDP